MWTQSIALFFKTGYGCVQSGINNAICVCNFLVGHWCDLPTQSAGPFNSRLQSEMFLHRYCRTNIVQICALLCMADDPVHFTSYICKGQTSSLASVDRRDLQQDQAVRLYIIFHDSPPPKKKTKLEDCKAFLWRLAAMYSTCFSWCINIAIPE